eukprot:91993-Chlamydomonas_euryale.AAC.1
MIAQITNATAPEHEGAGTFPGPHHDMLCATVTEHRCDIDRESHAVVGAVAEHNVPGWPTGCGNMQVRLMGGWCAPLASQPALPGDSWMVGMSHLHYWCGNGCADECGTGVSGLTEERHRVVLGRLCGRDAAGGRAGLGAAGARRRFRRRRRRRRQRAGA